MVWTTPKSWTVAELATAANMNVHVRDNTSFLFNIPRYRAYRTTGLVMNNATNTGIACDNEQYDTASLFAPTSDSFVTNVAGLWEVYGSYCYGPFVADGVRLIWITSGGVLISEKGWQPNAAYSIGAAYQCQGQHVLSAGATVQIVGWQNTGAARTTSSIPIASPMHSGSWVGA